MLDRGGGGREGGWRGREGVGVLSLRPSGNMPALCAVGLGVVGLDVGRCDFGGACCFTNSMLDPLEAGNCARA